MMIAHTTRNGRPSMQVSNRPGSITQPQYDYIVDMLEDKNLWSSQKWFEAYNACDATEYEQHLAMYRRELLNVTKLHASKVIDALRALPPKPREDRRTPESHAEEAWHVSKMNENFVMTNGATNVPRGSFALHTPGANHVNDITFYSVWISHDGERWSLKQYVSDELVRLQRSAQYMILNEIAKDPCAAASLYGLEIGKCGICHRKLTNDVSRARGIGPICAERFGW